MMIYLRLTKKEHACVLRDEHRVKQKTTSVWNKSETGGWLVPSRFNEGRDPLRALWKWSVTVV